MYCLEKKQQYLPLYFKDMSLSTIHNCYMMKPKCKNKKYRTLRSTVNNINVFVFSCNALSIFVRF